jgi:hypothetical protein
MSCHLLIVHEYTAECTLVVKRSAACRAGSFYWGCRHRMLLATRILLDLVRNGSEKIG